MQPQETDIRELVGVGFAGLEGVDALAQGELDVAVRDKVQHRPCALLEETHGATP